MFNVRAVRRIVTPSPKDRARMADTSNHFFRRCTNHRTRNSGLMLGKVHRGREEVKLVVFEIVSALKMELAGL
jgi:hypothetical protein